MAVMTKKKKKNWYRVNFIPKIEKKDVDLIKF